MKNHFRYHLAFLFVLCVTYSKTSICQESARQLEPQFIDFNELPFEMSPVVPPTFPDKTFDIRQYGAREGGSFKNTLAIAATIEACYNAGGGKVLIPEGVWLTGPIHFKSNINLHIAEGAEVRFSQDQADYLPVVFTRWEGIECYNYSPLIYARDCENIALTGKGIFDGQGDYWWA